jgi:hypothetical protein
MYSTCLFCHGDLGANEVVEHFPVGRRLAFDAPRGRLWAVCRKCERWNLTPIEERWEAIEECERLFRETKLRVSTDNIGLARVREGLELVRIGSALRPEMAAWRYGDQFGRRRARYIALSTAGAAALVGVVVAGPVMGLVAGGGFGMFQIANAATQAIRNRRVRARFVLPRGVRGAGEDDSEIAVVVRRSHLEKAMIEPYEDGWRLWVHYHIPRPVMTRIPFGRTHYDAEVDRGEIGLTGDLAIRVAGQLLPAVNSSGANKASVARAVGLLEQAPDPHQLISRFVLPTDHGPLSSWRTDPAMHSRLLKRLPEDTRLALEMAVHEDSEHRALEGELALLERAWQEAEEIASIADAMFVPDDATDRFDELKRTTPGHHGS